ncbi:hypothetical protein ACJX0J_013603, partial [Zea mays]
LFYIKIYKKYMTSFDCVAVFFNVHMLKLNKNIYCHIVITTAKKILDSLILKNNMFILNIFQ